MTQSIEHLLDTVSREIKALEIARQCYAQQLAPDFSVFNYIYTDEMMLSRMIADLLDPQGKHAQGEIFLQLFLHQLANHHLYTSLDIKRAKISTEVLTTYSNTQRRMDIYIEIPYLSNNKTFGICIENKPYAADQFQQLTEYAAELEKRHPKYQWHMIYLTGSNHDASIHSVETETLQQWKSLHLYTKIHYPSLDEWLKACQVKSENYKVNSFIHAFSYFIQKQFSGIEDMSETKQITNIILKNQTSLEAAFAISTSLHQAKNQLIDLLIQQIENTCNDKKWQFIDLGMKDAGRYCGFEIKFGYEITNISIGLEFQYSGHRMPIMGVWTNSLETQDNELNQRIFATAQPLFKETPKISKHWPFYVELCKDDTKMWLQIQNGQFTQKLMNYFEKIDQLLKKLDTA